MAEGKNLRCKLCRGMVPIVVHTHTDENLGVQASMEYWGRGFEGRYYMNVSLCSNDFNHPESSLHKKNAEGSEVFWTGAFSDVPRRGEKALRSLRINCIL